MNIYYVYIYKHPITNIPFYVGYGKHDRMYSHIKEAKSKSNKKSNKHKINTINKILKLGLIPTIVIVDSNISKSQACELEEFLIAEIGRADLNLGPLTNKTKGGDGNRDWSNEAKATLSSTNANLVVCKHITTNEITKMNLSDPRWLSGDWVGINKGNIHTEESKQKMTKSRTGIGNPMYGKSRHDLSLSNRNTELNIKRRETFKALAKMKMIKRFKFDSEESCIDYFTKLSTKYNKIDLYHFIRNIRLEYITDFPHMAHITNSQIFHLFDYFGIFRPKRGK